jgi:NADPH:quinone reductase-like Zn-dependent oxidoreductase
MANPLPSTMRAVQWTSITGGIEKNLKVNTTAPVPTLPTKSTEPSTLVKVAYSSINPVDYKLPEFAFFRALKMSTPAIPAGDFAGTVIQTTLPGLKPGDLVFGRSDPPDFGGLAEYVVVNGRENVVKLPKGVSMQDAATLGVAGLTAYQCIAPYTKEGSKVFINGGSGGTGTFGIQIAKILGCRVTATCSGANVELCQSLGADEVIDYRTTDVVKHLQRQGTQYDLLVDNVGSLELYWNAHDYLKADGLYINIAGTATLAHVVNVLEVSYMPAWLGGGQRAAMFLRRKSNADDFAKIAQWIAEGRLRPVVEKVYGLDEAGEAFARLKAGRSKGKLVIKVAGE